MGGVRDAAGALLGASVQEHRRAAGLTQQQLAQRSGLSVGAVRDLEQGRSSRPRRGSLDALARALGLDVPQSAALAAAGDATHPASGGAPAGHGSGLWLAVLGPLAAWRDGLSTGLGPPRQAAVAGLLAVQPGELVRRETVIDVLWGQRPPATAAELVQAHVSRLRRVLDPGGRGGLLEQGPAGYRLRAGAGELDAAAFAELAGRAGAAAASGDAAAACGLYARALALWRGEPAADAPVLRGHPAVTDMVRRQAEAVLGYADAACGLGWHQRVLPLLEELARQQPLEERVHARLMVALAGAGQQAAAIGAFEAVRRRLDEDLGVRPGPELTAAHQRVLRQDVPPPRGAAVVTGRPAPDAGPGSAPRVVYSLPPDTAAFTGRHAELGAITASVTAAAGSGGVVAICAIGGMPGVGKTTLAVHAAHLLKDRFPDRQLFLNLHAHTPGQDQVTPLAALAGLLAAVGVDARYLPADLAGRTALWRDRMAGQKALLVLDNAASTAQVTPLLPGSQGCMVLVTSRRHLGDLPGAPAPVQLPVLTPQEAREMFTRLAPRAAAGPDQAVAELAELAGYLPLAVSLLARVYARHPSWTLADLAAETRAGLLTLTAERDSVGAAFELSYQHLAPAQQQFFRRLGLHPATSTDAYAAAALAGIPLQEAAGQLEALHGEGLLTETGHRRYGMHDLIRSYAQDLAATDPPGSRQQALDRLLDYYQHTAALAEKFLARQARTRPAPALQAVPAAVPDLNGRTRALAWARAERDSMLACLDQATEAGQQTRVVTLTAAMTSLLRLDGPWTTAITRHAAAVQAARHLGDRLALANALTDLGDVRQLTGDLSGATQALEGALGISRDIGDQLGQANALRTLGIVRQMTGDYRGAAQVQEQALGIFRDIGSQMGQAYALRTLGIVRRMTGDYRGAAQALEQALHISRDISSRLNEVETLNETGTLFRVRGDPGRATDYHRQALNLSREIASPRDEACALTGLGRCALAIGHTSDAAEDLRQALDIFQRIGAAEAADVAAELDSLTGADP